MFAEMNFYQNRNNLTLALLATNHTSVHEKPWHQTSFVWFLKNIEYKSHTWNSWMTFNLSGKIGNQIYDMICEIYKSYIIWRYGMTLNWGLDSARIDLETFFKML